MQDLPLDQLFAAGLAGVICATVLIGLAMILRHLKTRNDDEA